MPSRYLRNAHSLMEEAVQLECNGDTQTASLKGTAQNAGKRKEDCTPFDCTFRNVKNSH